MHIFSFRLFQEIYLETGNCGCFWKESYEIKDSDGKTPLCSILLGFGFLLFFLLLVFLLILFFLLLVFLLFLIGSN